MGARVLDRRSFLKAGGGLAAGIAVVGASGPAAARSSIWETLRERLSGTLVLPGSPDYASAKQLQIAEFDAVNPRGIAYCVDPRDVRTCVGFAKRYDIPVRVRSGGHNFLGWSTTDGLVIDVSRINHVTVGGGTVSIGPGSQSIDTLDKLRTSTKQVITGTCPTVASGGFLSGGGIGWQTRTFGVGSDRIASVGVVLADGRLVRATPDCDADLLWAVRGGGGNNFGVVVDFEVRPIDAPQLVGYTAAFGVDRAAEVLAAWQRWVVDAPRELGSQLVVVSAAAAGGADTIVVNGGYLGTKAQAQALLSRLATAAGTAPRASNVTDPQPYADTLRALLCQDLTVRQCHRSGHNPEAQLPRTRYERLSCAMTAGPLSVGQSAALLDVWDSRHAVERRYLQFIAVGGAARELSPRATAYVHRRVEFNVAFGLALESTTPPADQVAAAAAWTADGAAALEPITAGSYINFPSTSKPANWTATTYGENYSRLLRVKRAYDPGDFFRHPQSIGS